MPATKLTSRFCETVKPIVGRQIAYPDTLSRGLELRVSGDGRKVWSLRYRSSDGRQSRLTLGTYPALDLANARSEADQRIGKIAACEDPASQKRQAKHRSRTQPIKTFDDLADAYLAACAAGEWRPKGKPQRQRTQDENRDVLRRHARPALGALRLEEIGRPAVKALLREMVTRGIRRQTNQTQAVIRQVYAFGIAEERVTLNPATGFTPLVPTNQRARVLTDDELRRFWRGLSNPNQLQGAMRVNVSRAIGIALQLAALTLQRKSEVAGMALSELNLDEGVWIVPAERMKSGRVQVVPLVPTAVTLIREALELRPAVRKGGAISAYVFPSSRDPCKPLRGDSVSKAMGRITAAIGVKGATPHDLRRTGATMLTSERAGVRRFVVSKVLGHAAVEGSAVTEVYDRNEYLPDKRRALEAWEGLLLEIVGARPAASNVVNITGAA